MKNGFRQSMGWVHTWGGLVVGWVLFFMFLTGTAGYFDAEIDRWMQPEHPLVQPSVPTGEMVARAIDQLKREAPDAGRWFIGLPDDRSPALRLFWRTPPKPDGTRGKAGSARLDPATGEPGAYRDTGGGQFLYRLHYRLHYLPATTAYWIVGVCTMFMFVAIVTGVIIHKRIFRDFFTFRPRKGQRSWLDAHNALSVLALPFHLMITYSGLLFFAYLYMAPVVAANYGFGDAAQDTYFDEVFERGEIPEHTGTPAALTPIAPLLRQAEARTAAGNVQYLDIHNPGDANARIVIAGGPLVPSRAQTALTFDGTSGKLLRVSDTRPVATATFQTLLGLHEGLFAGPVLRWLYFLTGLTGTAMIGAGLVLWTAKRRAKIGETIGFRLVERLNVGTIGGLPVAIAAYFWANRLIPTGVEGRAAWEGHALFIAWAVMLAHAFVRPPARAWGEQLWIAAAAFALLPLVNALTTERHLGAALPAGAWDYAGFDLTVLAMGIGFALAAWRIGRRHVRSDARIQAAGWHASPRRTEPAE